MLGRWVSVKDHLPEDVDGIPSETFTCNRREYTVIKVIIYNESNDTVDVVVRNKGAVLDGRSLEPIWAWIDCEFPEGITHWMPLPEKPNNQFSVASFDMK